MNVIGATLLLSCCFAVNGFPQTQKKVERSTDSGPRLDKLLKLSELPLSSNQSATNEAYRLVIWPTFYGPVSVRIEKKENVIRLTAKKLRGAGGYEVWGIENQKEITLSQRQLQQFKRLLTAANYTHMPIKDVRFEERSDGTALICLDGAEWILEQVVDGKHHVVERYCPEDVKLHKIGFLLVKLSTLKIPKAELF